MALVVALLSLIAIPSAWSLGYRSATREIRDDTTRSAGQLPEGSRAETRPLCASHESLYVHTVGGYRFCYDAAEWFAAPSPELPTEVNLGPPLYLGRGGLAGVSVIPWTESFDAYLDTLEGERHSRSPATVGGRQGIRFAIRYRDGDGAQVLIPRLGDVVLISLASSDAGDRRRFERILDTMSFDSQG